MKRPLIIIFLVLLIDQTVKIWIKTTMRISDEFPVLGEWFYIHFTENNGMAFGLELEGSYGKLILSLFRIAAVAGITYYMWRLVKEQAPKGLVASIALILAGALGNIIDSSFYGLLFSGSYYEVASFLPEGGGYAPFLHGKVVDMLWFPIAEGTFPAWVPYWGGEPYMFFRPVFNIADSSITIGVAMIILFQRRYFVKPLEDEDEAVPKKLSAIPEVETVAEEANTSTPDADLPEEDSPK